MMGVIMSNASASASEQLGAQLLDLIEHGLGSKEALMSPPSMKWMSIRVQGRLEGPAGSQHQKIRRPWAEPNSAVEALLLGLGADAGDRSSARETSLQRSDPGVTFCQQSVMPSTICFKTLVYMALLAQRGTEGLGEGQQ